MRRESVHHVLTGDRLSASLPAHNFRVSNGQYKIRLQALSSDDSAHAP